ncbi:hypothetical protein [Georgenia sp. AZ-5]|uniref:hypothetical protein n=1 Tax=Georgenia sp. AZ-5 TaxID=3367526 RepID=UPI003754EE14
MPTQKSKSTEFCPACGETVTVHWSRIVEKNAAGETLIDNTEGRCAQNHLFEK